MHFHLKFFWFTLWFTGQVSFSGGPAIAQCNSVQQAGEQSQTLFPQKPSADTQQLYALLHLLRQSQEGELDTWVQTHQAQSEKLQLRLLADALFARLHLVPAMAPDSLQLLDALSRTQLIPSMQPYRRLLEAQDFHTSLYRLMHSPEAASRLPDTAVSEQLESLLRNGLAYVFRVDDLPRIGATSSYNNQIYDRMIYIQLESEPDTQPEMLPLNLYLQTWKRDPKEIDMLILQAEQHGMPAFHALLLLEQAREQSSQTAAIELLKRAQTQAISIKSPMLQLQNLLRLSIVDPEADHEAKAEALLHSLSEGPMKQVGTKLWADYLLKQNRLAEAHQIYRQLADTGAPWMLDWLLSSFEQTLDREMLPLIERLTLHQDDQIGQKSLSVWLSLTPGHLLSDALNRIEPKLTDVRQGYLLASLPQLMDDKRALNERISAALNSDSIPLQTGALAFLQKQQFYNQESTEIPFLKQAILLLSSPHAQVQLAALSYLSSRKHFEPTSLALLNLGDIEQRRKVLLLLQSVAADVPPDAIQPFLQAKDRELRLNALAICVLSQPNRIEDFITLWSEERFLNVQGFDHALAEALKSGAISWSDWRVALEQSVASKSPYGFITASKLFWSLAFLGPLPDQAVAQLDELLRHPNPQVRNHAIQRLRSAPRSVARNQLIAELAKQENDLRMRVEALHYLADFPDKTSLDLFHKALNDPSEEIREAARRYFSKFNPQELEARLAQSRNLPDVEVLGLINSLTSAHISPQDLKPKIRSLISERSPAFHKALVTQLLRFASEYLDPDIINSLITPDSLDLELIRFLVRKPIWLKKESLKKLLESDNPTARSSALVLAEARGDVTFFDSLTPLLRDQRRVPVDLLEALDYHFNLPVNEPISIGYQTLRVLNSLDEVRTQPLLPSVLGAPDACLRRHALELLNKTEIGLSSDQLQSLLEDTDKGVRFEALRMSARQLTQPEKPRMTEHRLDPERWIPFLRVPDPTIRARVSFILETHPQLKPQHLTPLLQDQDPETKRLAQKLLAILDTNKQTKGLPHFLAELRERPHLVYKWKQYGLPPDLSWEQLYAGVLSMIEALPPQEPYTADSLAQTLTEIKGSGAIPDLLKLLDTHEISSYILMRVSTPRQVLLYAELLEQGKSPRTLSLAITLLNHHKETGYLSRVIPYITHSDPELQGSAIRYVGNYGSETDRALLLPLLNASPMPYGIIEALESHPIPSAFNQILAQLEHPDQNIRSYAIHLTGAWKIRAAIPILIRLLNSNTEERRPLAYAILLALGKIGDPSAIPVLRKELTLHPYSLVAIQSLYSLGDVDTAHPALLSYLEQAESDDRISALELIKEVQDKGMVPYLINQLPSRESGVSYQAESSFEVGELASWILEDLAEPEHVPELIRQLPTLFSERQESVDDIIESISKRYTIWPSTVLSELSKLRSHSDPVISQAAKKWVSKTHN